ncbi:Uncharacterized conserved protein YndB, AHSA1/START domain [Sphingomonas sp. OV641]|uniref:SRPBCC family protein n=1 Tax=Sphingomonas sp. OV641 TaxID=1881068 RepID=UPI0008BC1EAB|nr:SRPBCC family protein [Sphingomonas sp. OV641]SEJ60419.1 Uncharacterized conserved protein YndB, AHSA1/START domain [Sphingomonas sp. OV641]
MFELRIERVIDAPIDRVWTAWTEHYAEWFVPRPWSVEVIENDLRTGGRCAMVMRGPEGEEMPSDGLYLEVVPQRRIVSTDAFLPGWIPAGPFMVRIDEFAGAGEKTHYTAIARHWTEEARDQHAAMGFDTGWNAATDQLEEVVARIR